MRFRTLPFKRLQSLKGNAAGILLSALLFLLAVGASAPLFAADSVITFDEIAASPTVGLNTQYQASKGVVFETGYVNSANPPAHTGSNVGMGAGSGELSVPYVRGHFTNPHHNYVSVWVRIKTSQIEMDVWDLNGATPGSAPLKTVSTPANLASGTWTQLTISVSSRNLYGFAISGNYGEGTVTLDDLRFDDIGTLEGPDFYFYQNLSRTTLIPGGAAVTVRFYVGRRAGSTGNINPVIYGLPSGVTASLNPNPIGSDRVDVTLQASAGASNTNGEERVATMRGDPSASAGAYGSRTTSLPIVVVDQFNLRIVSMEVTQGTQPFDIPGPNLGNRTAPVTYGGVRLAEDGKTSVKVYFNQSTAYAGKLPGFSIKLYGWHIPNPANPALRETLVDSPIIYDKIVGTPTQGSDTLTDKHRTGTEGATAVFTLPWTWSRGDVQLEAVIEYPPSFFPPTAWDTNEADNHLAMNGIKFNKAVAIGIEPIELKVTNPPGLWPLPDPWDVFHQTPKVIPGPYYTAATGWWRATLDITDVWNQTEKACGFLGLDGCPEDNNGRKDSVLARMKDLADDIKEGWYIPHLIDDAIIGIFPANTNDQKLGGVTTMECGGPYWACSGNPVAIVRGQNRPLSSVAHEVGHLLGRNHAGGACTASAEKSPFDPWLPDGQGFLSSVAYDWESGTTLFPDRNGVNPQYWDIMSYCGQNGNQDPDKGSSVQGWELLMNAVTSPVSNGLAAQSAGSIQPSPQQASPQQAPAPVLVVRGFTNTDGYVMVTKIAKGDPNRPIPADPASPYKVQAKNAAGAVIAEVKMLRETSDDGGDTTFLSAHVPAANVQSIDIVKDTKPVARRVRSAHPPTVTGLAVQTDVIRAGVRLTRAQWTAADADGDKLTAKVDYSADNGATWKTIFFGANANVADLLANFLSKSGGGKIRVRVSDGFNETEAISTAFNATGHPPIVIIYSPEADQSFQIGGAVQLQGQATDDKGEPVPDASMKWYEGDTLLGTGANVAVKGLGPGSHTFRLVATDGGGLEGSANVTALIER